MPGPGGVPARGCAWSGRECTWSCAGGGVPAQWVGEGYLVTGCTWSWGVYLVLGGVPGPGGVPGLGGVPGPRGVYLVLGGVPAWGVYLVWGVPGLGGTLSGGYLVPGGVTSPVGVYLVQWECTWSQGALGPWGGVPAQGGVPGPGGSTYPGTPPLLWTE